MSSWAARTATRAQSPCTLSACHFVRNPAVAVRSRALIIPCQHPVLPHELHPSIVANDDRPPAAEAGSVHQSAAHLARSATAIEESVDRNTRLAANRTVLAAERSYAAWVRTALASLATGVGARTLLAQFVPDWLALVAGSVLILFAAFCLWAGVWRELHPGADPSWPNVRRIPTVVLLTVNLLLILVTLAALVGIWTV